MTLQPDVQHAFVGRAKNRERLARLVTEILAPAPTIVVLSLIVAWQSTPTAAEALKWGLLAALFASVLPFAFILLGVRRRRLTDHHVGVRQQRLIPFLFAAASMVVGLGLLGAWGAPSKVVALVAAMLAGLVTSILVTLFWKLSIHAAVIAVALTILTFLFGPWGLALTPLLGLVAWARVVVGDHDLAQVIAGAALGLTVAGVVFPLVR